MAREEINVKVSKLREDAILPTYATPGSSCFDLYALDDAEINPGETAKFDIGLAFEVPEGYEMTIHSRSGHGFKSDVRLSNCTGIIDSDYRLGIQVKLKSDLPLGSNQPAFKVSKGDRIAQAKITPVPKVKFILTNELSATERVGGFGSTGN